MDFQDYELDRSSTDKLQNIKTPKCLTPKLAEFIGIIVGDGHIDQRIRRDRSTKVYEFQIVGNITDAIYYDKYLRQLTKDLFNMSFRKSVNKKQNAIILYKNSKSIHAFLTKEFNIPARKHRIKIPVKILNSNKSCKARFLRGLYDTDGCFVVKLKPNKYPVVQLTSKSKMLILDTAFLLRELKIESCNFKDSYFDKRTQKIYEKYSLHINGRKRVSSFMKKIGFANSNKIRKYEEFLACEKRKNP